MVAGHLRDAAVDRDLAVGEAAAVLFDHEHAILAAERYIVLVGGAAVQVLAEGLEAAFVVEVVVMQFVELDGAARCTGGRFLGGVVDGQHVAVARFGDAVHGSRECL